MKISEREYRTTPAINASSICAGLISMKHMYGVYNNSHHTDSPAMMFGRRAHMAVLQPELWLESAQVWSGPGSKSSKAFKEWRADLGEIHADFIVDLSTFEKLEAMAAEVWANREACALLDGCLFEEGEFWTTDKYGNGKAKIDAKNDDRRLFLDYKTTSKIQPADFMRSAYYLNYHIRMGWYLEAFEVLTGHRYDAFFIVQETAEPFDCYVVHIPAAVLNLGRSEAVEVARKYHAHTVANCFPGISGDTLEFELPKWIADGDEEDISTGTTDPGQL